MTVHSLARSLILTAAFGLLFATPSSARESKSEAQASAPLKLNKFARKPVASSATRTVKKRNGEYAHAASRPRPKQRAEQPPVTPETLSPAAAQAFASYELARVRVVTPEEISLLTNAASAAVTLVGAGDVQVVRADEINEIDRKADSPRAVSLDSLSRSFVSAADTSADEQTWFQRLLLVLGSAFAAVAALVKTLLG